MGSMCPNARLEGLNKNRERKGEQGSTRRASSGAPSHGHQEQRAVAATATSGEAGRAERDPHATEDSDQLAMHDQRAVAELRSRAQARDARPHTSRIGHVVDFLARMCGTVYKAVRSPQNTLHSHRVNL